jgi:3-hydroxyacyl-[acyl-carrier-protein] dehydratase
MKDENAESTAYDICQIMKIIPHRYPFLLVDKILRLDTEKGEIFALKNVTMNEAYFQGHFPDAPIMPGVLILEALAQAGGVLVHMRCKTLDKVALLLNINSAKFRRPVRPGDVMELHCTGIHFSARGGKVKACARVNGVVACEAEIWFALADKEQL